MYREAIEQKRAEKEALTQRVATQQKNKNLCKNKAKFARCESGRLEIKIRNELATLDRLR